MDNTLKIYYDAEFTGLHKNTELISIGLISESGSYFYAEFSDLDHTKVDDWIKENVIKNLLLNNKNSFSLEAFQNNGELTTYNIQMCDNKEVIREELIGWIKTEYNNSGKSQVQIMTDCYAYDWVLFNDLICKNGNALEIPKYINYIPIDLCSLLYIKGIDPDINREEFSDINNNLDNIIDNIPLLSKCKNNNYKHNSLWDAIVCKYCFEKIYKM